MGFVVVFFFFSEGGWRLGELLSSHSPSFFLERLSFSVLHNELSIAHVLLLRVCCRYT